jgi:hypothetical protein
VVSRGTLGDAAPRHQLSEPREVRPEGRLTAGPDRDDRLELAHHRGTPRVPVGSSSRSQPRMPW